MKRWLPLQESEDVIADHAELYSRVKPSSSRARLFASRSDLIHGFEIRSPRLDVWQEVRQKAYAITLTGSQWPTLSFAPYVPFHALAVPPQRPAEHTPNIDWPLDLEDDNVTAVKLFGHRTCFSPTNCPRQRGLKVFNHWDFCGMPTIHLPLSPGPISMRT